MSYLSKLEGTIIEKRSREILCYFIENIKHARLGKAILLTKRGTIIIARVGSNNYHKVGEKNLVGVYDARSQPLDIIEDVLYMEMLHGKAY